MYSAIADSRYTFLLARTLPSALSVKDLPLA